MAKVRLDEKLTRPGQPVDFTPFEKSEGGQRVAQEWRNTCLARSRANQKARVDERKAKEARKAAHAARQAKVLRKRLSSLWDVPISVPDVSAVCDEMHALADLAEEILRAERPDAAPKQWTQSELRVLSSRYMDEGCRHEGSLLIRYAESRLRVAKALEARDRAMGRK